MSLIYCAALLLHVAVDVSCCRVFCGMRQGPKMLHRLDWYRDIDLAVPYCHKPLAEADAVNSR